MEGALEMGGTSEALDAQQVSIDDDSWDKTQFKLGKVKVKATEKFTHPTPV